MMIGTISASARDTCSSASRRVPPRMLFTSRRHRSQTMARSERSIASTRRRPSQSSDGAVGRAAPTIVRKISSSDWPVAAAGAQLGQRALRDQPALVDDADVIAEPLDDLEDVRRQEHRAAAVHEVRRAGP